MKRAYRITASRRAERMMLSHVEFLSRVSANAAHRLFRAYAKAQKPLSENPAQYPFADEFDAPGIPPETYRKCLIDGRYKILYLIEGNEVYIDAVLDCRQENSNLYPQV